MSGDHLFWQKLTISSETALSADKNGARPSARLKEPNGYKGEYGALNDLLRKAAEPNSNSKMWNRPTFHNVGRWTHGLPNYSDQVPAYDEANRACKTAVLACAYINIKKSSGGARATKKVEDHAAKYAEFLKRQVSIIDPDIVVCGGTYAMLKKHVYPSMSRVSSVIQRGTSSVKAMTDSTEEDQFD